VVVFDISSADKVDQMKEAVSTIKTDVSAREKSSNISLLLVGDINSEQ
jgi:hypothetical protein